MRSVITIAIGAVALAACSTAPPAGTYVKPGVTAEQLARDRGECAAAAVASDNRSLTLPAGERESVDSCMRARGYSTRPGAERARDYSGGIAPRRSTMSR